jgi:hypothetical protein
MLSLVSSRLIIESQSGSVSSPNEKGILSRSNSLLFDVVVYGKTVFDDDSILDKYSSIHFYNKKKKCRVIFIVKVIS